MPGRWKNGCCFQVITDIRCRHYILISVATVWGHHPKKHLCLLPYAQLPESEKEFDAAIKIGPVAGGAYNDALAGKRKLAQP